MSGVGAAINREIGASDVGRFWPSDKRYQRGNLVNVTIAFERGVSDLRFCPIACGGIQVSINGSRLNIVDRDAARANLPRQPPA